jgi:hypothetical protein
MLILRGTKRTKQQYFQNHMNKNMPSSKSKSWILKNKNKNHDVCIMWMQKDFILKIDKKKNKIITNICTLN